MNAWLEVGLSNAVLASLLAAVIWLAVRRVRNPRVVVLLWIVVLLRFIAPPIVNVPVLSITRTPDPVVIVPDVSTPVLSLPMEQGSAQRAAISGDRVFAQPAAGEPVTELSPLREVESPEIASIEQPAEQGRGAPSAWPRIDWASGVRWASGLWLASTCVWLVVAVLRIARFRRMLRRATPAPADIVEQVEELSAAFGLRRVPDVRMVERRISPLVWALFGRPVIVLPARLLPALDADERQSLLAHELAHVAACDHVARWLELATVAIYWWHPVAWWVRRNIERAQEECCDQRVIGRWPELRRAYAAAMLTTVEFLDGAPRVRALGVHGFSEAPFLRRRIEMVLHGTSYRTLTWPAYAAIATLSLAAMLFSLRSEAADPPAADPVAETTVAPADATPDDTKPGDKAAGVAEAKPSPALAAFLWESLGVRLAVATEWKIKEYQGGLAITEIRPGSPAEKAKLNVPDTLVQIEDHPIPTFEALEEYLTARLGEQSPREADRKYQLPPGERVLHVVKKRTHTANYSVLIDGKRQPRTREITYSLVQPVKLTIEAAHDLLPILGPITSGEVVRAVEPPSDDEIMRVLERARPVDKGAAQLHEVQRTNVRIVKEKFAEFVDPPKFYPQVGPAQQHHAHYKCTIYCTQVIRVNWPVLHAVVEEDTQETVYLDHNHLHVLANVDEHGQQSASEIDKLLWDTIGMRVEQVSDADMKVYTMSDLRAVRVAAVRGNSPAEKGYIGKGDVLVELWHRPTPTPTALAHVVMTTPADVPVGNVKRIGAPFADRPNKYYLMSTGWLQSRDDTTPGNEHKNEAPVADPAADRILQQLGLKLEQIPKDRFAAFKSHYRGGLLVTEVRTDSAAHRQKVRVGDVLVGLHTFETISLESVEKILDNPTVSKNERLKFYILRSDGERFTIYYGYLTTDAQDKEAELVIPPGDRVALQLQEFRSDLGPPLALEALSQFSLEYRKALAAAMSQALFNLGDKSWNKPLAADDQLDAVTAAYEAQTATIDQLIEARRIAADAKVAYHRRLVDAHPDRALIEASVAWLNLQMANTALEEARQLWSKVHQLYLVGTKPGISEEEAKAREHYFRCKSTTQTLLDELLRADARLEYERRSQEHQSNQPDESGIRVDIPVLDVLPGKQVSANEDGQTGSLPVDTWMNESKSAPPFTFFIGFER